ncbi:MAG TPA: Trp family transcriptional regulator [Patescibacteria group bacterium]
MTEAQLFSQLITLLSDIHSSSEMESFLTAFLTETEQSVLSKRLTILVLLDSGKSYEEISRELKVSSATISSIATIKDLPITQKALQLIKRDQQLNRLLGF